MAIARDVTGPAVKMTVAATSQTVDITTAATGSFVFCLVALGLNQASLTFTGWTQLLAGDESTATHYGLFWRQKIAGDTTFTVSWPSSTKGTIGWVSYTGLDPVTPQELAAVTLHTTGTSFVSPSLTPSTAAEWALFCCYARDTTLATDLPDGTAWAPDAALTELLDASNPASTGTWVAIEFADSGAAVTQAAHSYTAVSATAESHGAAFLLFLNPAAAAGGGILPQPGSRAWRRRFRPVQQIPPAGAPAPPAAAAAAPVMAPVLPRAVRGRARLGGRAMLAAGILATGIGPSAVPAPHQPPAITHPAPHRAIWRSGRGSPPGAPQQVKVPVTVFARRPHAAIWRGGAGSAPNAAQQVKVPVTVWSRKPHGAVWRAGRGAVPAAMAQPFTPKTVYTRTAHRASWRGGAGTAIAAAQGSGSPQPFRPATVFARRPHGAAWRGVAGAAPSAQRQPFRPVTVFSRGAHRALWRAVTGQPPAVAQNLGAPQPFRPVTVYARKPHGALWKTLAGRPPSPAAQPFRPATVFRRAVHGATWRAGTGRPPAAAKQPFRPATVFARARHRAAWHGGLGSPAAPPPPFTVGALTAMDAPGSVLAPAVAGSALTASTAPSGALTAAVSAAGSGAEYGGTYSGTYGPAEGTLTATDQRTGGPG